jgi:hypothetical protein
MLLILLWLMSVRLLHSLHFPINLTVSLALSHRGLRRFANFEVSMNVRITLWYFIINIMRIENNIRDRLNDFKVLFHLSESVRHSKSFKHSYILILNWSIVCLSSFSTR